MLDGLSLNDVICTLILHIRNISNIKKNRFAPELTLRKHDAGIIKVVYNAVETFYLLTVVYLYCCVL